MPEPLVEDLDAVGAGEDERLIHIETALACEKFERVASRHRSSGNYALIEVTLVRGEENRLTVYRALQASPRVNVVI